MKLWGVFLGILFSAHAQAGFLCVTNDTDSMKSVHFSQWESPEAVSMDVGPGELYCHPTDSNGKLFAMGVLQDGKEFCTPMFLWPDQWVELRQNAEKPCEVWSDKRQKAAMMHSLPSEVKVAGVYNTFMVENRSQLPWMMEMRDYECGRLRDPYARIQESWVFRTSIEWSDTDSCQFRGGWLMLQLKSEKAEGQISLRILRTKYDRMECQLLANVGKQWTARCRDSGPGQVTLTIEENR